MPDRPLQHLSVFRINDLRSRVESDPADCDKFSNASRSLTGVSSIAVDSRTITLRNQVGLCLQRPVRAAVDKVQSPSERTAPSRKCAGADALDRRGEADGRRLRDSRVRSRSEPHQLRPAGGRVALTIEAQKRIAASPLSKREIVRRLGTSAAQLYRLLDQTNYRKSVDQLLALLQVLNCEVDLVVRTKTA